jgi:carbonic anhydrase
MGILMLYLFLSILAPATLLGVWMPSDDALTKLVEGNKRYMNETLKYANRSNERRTSSVEGQSPFAVILACSDSRTAPEIIFDQGIGDLFVVRVAGNVAGPVEIASIEYGVLALESSLVVVLGHQNCGAIQAVLAGQTQDIEPVANLIAPSVAKKNLSLEAATKINAQHFAKIVSKNPVLAQKIKDKRLKVVAGYYDFNSGKVEILE